MKFFSKLLEERLRAGGSTAIFGIIVGTSSSILTASPILLFLDQKRLRPAITQEGERSRPAEATAP